MVQASHNDKAICVKEPWASLIAGGLKTIETRKWSTRFRGPLVICSSKSKKGTGSGMAIAIADLVDCRPMTAEDWQAAKCDPYPRAFAWVLQNIRRLDDPFPIAVRLGLFDIGQAAMEARRTSDSVIKSAVRTLWLRSKERRAAIRDQGNRCRRCNAKESSRKGAEVAIEVHHLKGEIDWPKVIKFIREEVLVDPSELELLCGTCHHLAHGKVKKKMRSPAEGIPTMLSASGRNRP